MRRLLLSVAAVLPLYFSPCNGPTEPLEEWTMETIFGPLQVVGPRSAEPALAEGAALALQRATNDLPSRAHEFPGALRGWEVWVSGSQSSISIGARRMHVCATSAPCTTHGFFHELGTALAVELGSCSYLSQVWECGPFGPGRTLACAPC